MKLSSAIFVRRNIFYLGGPGTGMLINSFFKKHGQIKPFPTKVFLGNYPKFEQQLFGRKEIIFDCPILKTCTLPILTLENGKVLIGSESFY